jgi:hypothetical protein
VSTYPNYSQLRTMSEEAVIAELDRIAERSELGAQLYLGELMRRELARQSTTLLQLSLIMALLTFVVTVLAVTVMLNL